TLVIFLGLGYYLVDEYNLLEQENIQEKLHVPELKTDQTKKDKKSMLKGDLFQIIGEMTNVLEDEFGAHIRKDMTHYGYKWCVYLLYVNIIHLTGIKGRTIQMRILILYYLEWKMVLLKQFLRQGKTYQVILLKYGTVMKN